MPKFDELFNAGKYKEAAELAAASPQGALRTPAVVQRFQAVPQVKYLDTSSYLTLETCNG